MKTLPHRGPGYEATTFAEARTLLDDGLDRDFVLDLFAEDAAWLAPLLEATVRIGDAASAIEPSPAFEARLRARFVAGLRTAAKPVSLRAHREPARWRTAGAATALVGGAVAAGVLAVAVITSPNAADGDWNYVFRQAGGKIGDAFGGSEHRGVDTRLEATEQYVQQIATRSQASEVSRDDLEELARQAEEIAQEAANTPLDDGQKERLKSIGDASVQVLQEIRTRQPELSPAVEQTAGRVSEAVAAGIGGGSDITPPASVTPSETPAPSETPTATETPSPTATETGTATATETATTAGTDTATPTETPQPEPTGASTAETTPAP